MDRDALSVVVFVLVFVVPLSALLALTRKACREQCPEREPDWIQPEDHAWLNQWGKTNKWGA